MYDNDMNILCKMDDLPESTAREFQIECDSSEQDIFIIHHNGQVHAYVNCCPHAGLTLNWQPDQFLDADKTLIQCANHDALFRIEDGYCLAGPCVGKSLKKIPVMIDHGNVVIP